MQISLRATRRTFLKSAAVSGLIVTASSFLTRAFAAGDIKIGFVLPLTGPFAEAGELRKPPSTWRSKKSMPKAG